MEIFEPEVSTPTCFEGSKKCHANARCIDFAEGFCCECVPPFYGNGLQCVENGDLLFYFILICLAHIYTVVLFVGHRQTLQPQIGRRGMWRLIMVSTVSLQIVLLKFK